MVTCRDERNTGKLSSRLRLCRKKVRGVIRAMKGRSDPYSLGQCFTQLPTSIAHFDELLTDVGSVKEAA